MKQIIYAKVTSGHQGAIEYMANVNDGEFCRILDTLRYYAKLIAPLVSKKCYVNAFETPISRIVLKHRHFCLFKVVHEIQCMANNVKQGEFCQI